MFDKSGSSDHGQIITLMELFDQLQLRSTSHKRRSRERDTRDSGNDGLVRFEVSLMFFRFKFEGRKDLHLYFEI